MDHASSIEKPSRELKSTFGKEKNPSHNPKIYWAHRRGLQVEKVVIDHYMTLNFQLLKHRFKTPFAEIDLLLKSPEGYLLIVEVKSVNLSSFFNTRVSSKQKKRLEQALIFLSHQSEKPIEIQWAFVGANNKVTIIQDVYDFS